MDEAKNTLRWGKVHAWWSHHPSMEADHLAVMAMLSTYANDTGTCYPSQATLALRLKRSRPWVNRVIADLARFGLIDKTARTRTSNAGTTSCEYRLAQEPPDNTTARCSVTVPTGTGHDDDTPCHRGNMTQPITKQNNNARPARPGRLDQQLPEEVARPRPSPRIDVPADWAPSITAIARAAMLSPSTDLQAHIVKFVSRSRSKGYLYPAEGRDDAWLSWLAEDRLKEGAHTSGHRSDDGSRARTGSCDPGDRRLAAWAAAASTPRMGRIDIPKPTAENPWN